MHLKNYTSSIFILSVLLFVEEINEASFRNNNLILQKSNLTIAIIKNIKYKTRKIKMDGDSKTFVLKDS